MMNKKGNYQDIPEYLKVVVYVFFILIISFLILSNFNSGVQGNSNIDPTSKAASSSFFNGFLKLDFVIPIIYLIFLGFSVLAARFIPSSPKFMIISVVFLILIPIVAMLTDNFTNALLENSVISGASNSFKFSTFFVSNLTIFATVYSFIVGFALLTKGEVIQ